MARQPSRTACAGSAAGRNRGCGPFPVSTPPAILPRNDSAPPAGTGPYAAPLPIQAQLEHVKKSSERGPQAGEVKQGSNSDRGPGNHPFSQKVDGVGGRIRQNGRKEKEKRQETNRGDCQRAMQEQHNDPR
ncbi:hypothetical protein VTK56DRAFT_7030 [Thermocarpiscus australiensis]